MFSLPKGVSLRKKWIKAICRKDFTPANYFKVCELHFAKEAIRRNAEAYDEKSEIKIDVLLKICRLLKFAVPTIFPNCPKYMSSLQILFENVLSRDGK
ncbi:hypothetical protein NPIL_93131 [Nephila pilipes]|uniref:THAP-type domain-containing protein n=1 Tax=Nephila pilipes TaxID=299642 RepID=A0A8X6TDN3_NEPPI|nr:hypothetical protein NPIL_93131 [Nephila pilipes]